MLAALSRIAARSRGRNRLADGQPVRNHPDPARAAAAAGIIDRRSRAFWQTVTALGLTITPLLASFGRWRGAAASTGSTGQPVDPTPRHGRTVIFGFGRVGRMVADMLAEHGKPYLAVDSDIDAVLGGARGRDYTFCSAMSRGPSLVEKLNSVRPRRGADDGRPGAGRAPRPDLARPVSGPADHRPRPRHRPGRPLYKAGVTDAVPGRRSRPRCSSRKQCWSTSASRWAR